MAGWNTGGTVLQFTRNIFGENGFPKRPMGVFVTQ